MKNPVRPAAFFFILHSKFEILHSQRCQKSKNGGRIARRSMS